MGIDHFAVIAIKALLADPNRIIQGKHSDVAVVVAVIKGLLVYRCDLLHDTIHDPHGCTFGIIAIHNSSNRTTLNIELCHLNYPLAEQRTGRS